PAPVRHGRIAVPWTLVELQRRRPALAVVERHVAVVPLRREVLMRHGGAHEKTPHVHRIAGGKVLVVRQFREWLAYLDVRTDRDDAGGGPIITRARRVLRVRSDAC